LRYEKCNAGLAAAKVWQAQTKRGISGAVIPNKTEQVGGPGRTRTCNQTAHFTGRPGRSVTVPRVSGSSLADATVELADLRWFQSDGTQPNTVLLAAMAGVIALALGIVPASMRASSFGFGAACV
jgi:hypothetical protein